jgi:phosphotransferase system enzyme I (PtsI)
VKSSQELKLKGIPISPGILIAPVKVIRKEKVKIKEKILRSDTEIEEEINKFLNGIEELKRILLDLRRETQEQNLKVLLDVQIAILTDQDMQRDVITYIRNKRRNAESAILYVLNLKKEGLSKQESSYFAERARELERLTWDLISVINKSYTIADYNFDGIIVVESLSIEEALRIIKSSVKGVITEKGGRTEHSAIILRNFKIPAVFGIERITKLVDDNDIVILDGGKGVVIVNPMESTLQRYHLIKEGYERYESELVSEKELPAITTDGKEIGLFANIDVPEEVDELLKTGKYGIGLFRTEMIFREYAENEEAQYKIYLEIAKKIYPNSVTIRAFDIGGDKLYSDYQEENPFLGLRGIRVLLDEPAIFEKQIRAVIRANELSNIRFMLPMVATVEEVVEAKKLFIQAKKMLEKEYQKVNQPRFGVMIEIPSAVLLLEHIADIVDFVSIGTNDLTQYTLAVDRKNQRVSKIFDHLNPAVLKLIKMTTDVCREKNILVASCGEITSDPYGVVALVGLGVDELSCPPSRIPEVKSLIRRINLQEAENIASEVIKFSSSREVKSAIKNYIKKIMPELLEFYD